GSEAGRQKSSGGPEAAALAQIDALLQCRLHDPFALLGAHPVPGGWRVRAFLPEAARAWLAQEGGPVPLAEMVRVNPEGVFEVELAQAAGPPRYRLRLADAAGQSWLIDDPYALPPLLSDYDLHLLAQGRPERRWQRPG